MFLTIGISVFNEETRLPRMLDSLEKQDWSLFEVRFSNDGSTDRTEEIIRDFANRHAGHVFYESHEHEGPGLSRNRIIPKSRGDYIWFCDGDDAIAPGAIATLARRLEKSPYDLFAFLGGPPVDIPPALDSAPIPLTRPQAVQCVPLVTFTKILKTDFLLKKGILFPDIRIGEDIVFTLRAVCQAATSCFWHEKPYWHFRRQDSISAIVDDSFMEYMGRCFKYLECLSTEYPEFRQEINYRILEVFEYTLRRLRDNGTPEIQDRYFEETWTNLMKLADRHEDPLIRFPYRLLSKNKALGLKLQTAELKLQTAELKLQTARQKEQKLKSEIQTLHQSVSWRLTAPLRAIFRVISSRKQ